MQGEPATPIIALMLCTATTLKASTCVERRNDCLAGLHVLRSIDSVIYVQSACIPTEATIEYTDQRHPTIVDYVIIIQQLLDSRIIVSTAGEEETGKSLMGRGYWVTDVCYNRSEL